MAQQEPNEGVEGEAAPEIAEKEDFETLKQALAAEKEKAERYLYNWQRAQADSANYKRSLEREKEEAIRFANATLALSLFPILDDLERAFDSLPLESCEHPWANGIKLIGRKFRSTLEAQGLAEIKALGEPFDPRLHEAIRQDKGKEGIVVAELQKGYMFRDRVIRPSKVVVGNGQEEESQDNE